MSMEIVIGDDGKQYLQFSGPVAIQPPEGGPVAIQPPEGYAATVAYTIEQIAALRTWPNPYLPEIYNPSEVTMTAKRWLPGDPAPGDPTPGRSEPEHGRFQNLDWEAS